mgnify:CR=1 FL=1
MIFVVDSGSTKTDWISLNYKGDVLFSTQTLGLNPQVLPSAILTERIINNYDLYQNREKVFNTVKNEILESFKELKSISISSLLKKRSDRYISMGVFSD